MSTEQVQESKPWVPQVGDKVRCVNNRGAAEDILELDETYTVTEVAECGSFRVSGSDMWMLAYRFRPVHAPAANSQSPVAAPEVDWKARCERAESALSDIISFVTAKDGEAIKVTFPGSQAFQIVHKHIEAMASERDAAQTVLADTQESLDEARKQVAELEEKLADSFKQEQQYKVLLDALVCPQPLTLARVAEFLRSQYPSAEMLQVHVIGNGISVAPTTEELLQRTINAIKQMADGSREGA